MENKQTPKRIRRNKKAEYMGFTPKQIDFLVNMVNDEYWLGIDDTKLNLTEYIEVLEYNNVMNAMQAGMMLTTLRNKGMLYTEKFHTVEYGVSIYIVFTDQLKEIFEKLLDYAIKNNRIVLFDDSMTAKDLI
jgi:hypothetical protein